MQEPSTDTQQERVQEIPLSELHPFEGHPFRVADDEDMEKTVESIKEYGVLTPAIVRPDPYGGYEIISAHFLSNKKTPPTYRALPWRHSKDRTLEGHCISQPADIA